MIARVRGTLVRREGDSITVLTNGGVGYAMSIPIGVLERLPPLGKEVDLHTTLVVREDAWSLFGFDDTAEREVFEQLLHATGVGPRLALALVSALGSDRVVRAIGNGDLAALCTVPGVGRKKAERLVLELKDRMRDLEVAAPTGPGAAAEQAVKALVNLGYSNTDAETAVRAALGANGAAEAEQLVRGALQQLTRSK
jgi:holliday junction DNA helicase RuvA